MIISVKVIAGARQAEIIELEKDESGRRFFKIKVSQIAEDGKANEAVEKIISEFFKVKRSDVRIVSGATSKNKIIEINL